MYQLKIFQAGASWLLTTFLKWEIKIFNPRSKLFLHQNSFGEAPPGNAKFQNLTKLGFQVENEPHAAVITVKETTLRKVSLQPLQGNFPPTLAGKFPCMGGGGWSEISLYGGGVGVKFPSL